MKKIKKLVGIGVVFMIFIGAYFSYEYYQAGKNYRYTLNDVYYDHYVSDEIFDISSLNIRKEKEKEDVYEFELETMPSTPSATFGSSVYDISANLSKSEFEKIIGSGNNAISSQVYVLSLAVPAKYGLQHTCYYIDIYRYSCFGANDFSQEEIKEFAKLSLDVFCQANTSNSTNHDLTLIEEKIECMKLDLTSTGGENWSEGMLKLKE